MQGIVNGKMLFLETAAGFPGSIHDARILKNTAIYMKAENREVPTYNIGQHYIQPYLVGDSAYPLSPWLQKPHPDGTRNAYEIRFNKELSSPRVKVECAFGILEGKFSYNVILAITRQ